MFSDLHCCMKEAYWKKKQTLAFFFFYSLIVVKKNVTMLGILCRFQTFICDRGDYMPGGKKLLLLS